MIKITDAYDPTKPFNEQVRAIIEATHSRAGPHAVRPHGKRFSVEMDPDLSRDYAFMTATDGVGTKGLIHWLMGTHAYGAQDAFAMTADDLMEGGYVPISMQDHLMLQRENHDAIFSIVRELKDLCIENPWEFGGLKYPIAITGGETAILNTLNGFELGITMTGFVRRGEEIFPRAKAGDVIIGIESSGLHSNGYSFIRNEFLDKRGMALDDPMSWGVTLGQELTKPTNVYTPVLKKVLGSHSRGVHGMVHITGGGLSKLHELTKAGDVDVHVSNDHRLRPQEIFYTAYNFGCPSREMYVKFNNGVGYAIAAKRQAADGIIRELSPYSAAVMGEVKNGSGRVVIMSQYDGKELVY